MNESVRTEVEIDASPQRVWDVIMDLPAYPDWNPVLRWVKGDARANGALRFRIDVEGLPPLVLSARVCAFDDGRELAWTGGPRGVFTGVHYLRLTPLDDGRRTRLVHGEDFAGALVRSAFRRFVRPRIERSYDAMNRAIAARATK